MNALLIWLGLILTFVLSVVGKSESQVATSNDFVSLYELIVAPEEYADQTVLVIGYLFIESDTLSLYPTRDDARMGNYVTSVAIKLPPSFLDKKCLNNFVIVSGIFHNSNRAKSISNIYSISVIERNRGSRSRKVCYLETSR